jgi:hypothetical protein
VEESVYDEHIGVMADVLDTDAISAAVREFRE